MRREAHNSHAAHREEQKHLPNTHANDEPLKRSYERIIDGERAFPDELADEPVTVDAELAEPVVPETKQLTVAEVEREVDQALASRSGTSDEK